jgi:hypothetical protein
VSEINRGLFDVEGFVEYPWVFFVFFFLRFYFCVLGLFFPSITPSILTKSSSLSPADGLSNKKRLKLAGKVEISESILKGKVKYQI